MREQTGVQILQKAAVVNSGRNVGFENQIDLRLGLSRPGCQQAVADIVMLLNNAR